MTKYYLFALVTSTLLLILVVPLLSGLWWTPTQLASVTALSVISVAIGGLTAETYVIARDRTVAAQCENRAREYFVSLISSLLFLVIVAPSISTASANLADAATSASLLVLSLAVAGLIAQGFFGVITEATRKRVHRIEESSSLSNSSRTPSHGEKNLGAAAEIDSKFKALDANLDTRINELKQHLLSSIDDLGRRLSINFDTGAGVTGKTPPSQIMTNQVKHEQDQLGTPSKSPVIDVLLGKPKVGGK